MEVGGSGFGARVCAGGRLGVLLVGVRPAGLLGLAVGGLDGRSGGLCLTGEVGGVASVGAGGCSW